MSDMASAITRLEASLATRIGSSFPIDEVPDVVAELLASLRSPNTRRAYYKVQKLSRHEDINTVMTYDDNRNNHQDEMSNLLDDLV